MKDWFEIHTFDLGLFLFFVSSSPTILVVYVYVVRCLLVWKVNALASWNTTKIYSLVLRCIVVSSVYHCECLWVWWYRLISTVFIDCHVAAVRSQWFLAWILLLRVSFSLMPRLRSWQTKLKMTSKRKPTNRAIRAPMHPQKDVSLSP